MNSFISVIIPVRNGEKTIKKCIKSVLGLEYQDFELIIVNDGSTDRTDKIIDEYKDKIVVLSTDGVGPSAARNLAIKQAKGEYLAFTDADCIVDRNWLTELMKGFNSDKIVGVGGDQLSPEDDTKFGKNIQEFMKTIGFVTGYIKPDKNVLAYVNHNPTCNVMYKKTIFDEFKGFLDGLWPGEDVELDYRIRRKGYRLVYCPEAVVYHYRPENMAKFWRMMYNYGKVQAFLVKKYGFFRKIHLVPVFLSGFFIMELILLIKYFTAGIVLLCLVPVLSILFFLTKTKKISKTFNYTKLFFYTLLSWNCGFLKKILLNSKVT